ncbi:MULTISPECIES: phosphoribosylformylglycinamidine cyclo-ligase [unclassified Virgibacillus]|uniref:phosphoribosylformylglycinamidine cyclo-ligase n=1 Tax=unclassified Virgibacillus TaxID=2620237 RepID=UPI0024DE78CA|nr:phosphoribosylformylglycinamidine cyclo-ligase [Virgibacillus sp. LDC-1]
MSNIYKDAGVDVEKGYEAVERMKKHIAKTTRPEVLGGIGAFAGLFDLSGFSYREPVLVTGTDGVGTKLKLAMEMNIHHTVGIDLVAMCVNDIIAQGAQPLFFLDYIACGKNNPEKIEQLVAGIADGCIQAGAALIGGETAEMPGMYEADEYDLAGFTVGIAEKSKLITGDAITIGDLVIGLPSSGLHSNGFSLVRKVLAESNLQAIPQGFEKTLGEILLTPTKIYAKQIAAIAKITTIKGISHITGGGFYENIPRMLPQGLGVKLDASSWQLPDIFTYIQQRGNLSLEEMAGVFNMGIGMAVVVDKSVAQNVVECLQTEGEIAAIIGEVIEKEGVQIQW